MHEGWLADHSIVGMKRDKSGINVGLKWDKNGIKMGLTPVLSFELSNFGQQSAVFKP